MRNPAAGSATFLRAVIPAPVSLPRALARGSGAIAVAAGLFAACIAFAQTDSARPVTILSSPIPDFRIADSARRFGALRYVGGLQLQSDDKAFGGISGIRLLPDGKHFLAVTDAGAWLAGEIDRDAAGLPSGLSGTVMGSLLSPDAGFIARKRDADCEGIEIVGDRIYLSFERHHRILVLALAAGLPVAGESALFMEMNGRRLAGNKGLEALAAFPEGSPFAGSLLAISEESLDRQRNIRAFILDGQTVREFAFLKDGDYAVTDAVFLPGGDLLVLERAYSLRRGPAMRLRHVPAAAIAEGATVSGSVLMEADRNHWIDNMEGLDVSTDQDGGIRVTLVSDDNFSPLQRTLLLEFVIEP